MPNNVSRARPDPALAEGTYGLSDTRYTQYKEQVVFPLMTKMYPLADEGSYFVATNPTPGTGIAGAAAATTMDNTKPFILIKNTHSSRRMYLDYLKLQVTAAGTAGSLNYATHLIDSGAGYTSGGSTITPVSVNGDAVADTSLIYAGAVVATANAASQRLISNHAIRSVIPVVGDTIVFDYGAVSNPQLSMPQEGTLIASITLKMPPIIIRPAEWFKLVLWRASQTGAASYEFDLGYWLR